MGEFGIYRDFSRTSCFVRSLLTSYFDIMPKTEVDGGVNLPAFEVKLIPEINGKDDLSIAE